MKNRYHIPIIILLITGAFLSGCSQQNRDTTSITGNWATTAAPCFYLNHNGDGWTAADTGNDDTCSGNIFGTISNDRIELHITGRTSDDSPTLFWDGSLTPSGDNEWKSTVSSNGLDSFVFKRDQSDRSRNITYNPDKKEISFYFGNGESTDAYITLKKE